MPVCTPTTVSQVIDVRTFSALTMTIAFASVDADEAADTKSDPSHAVSGKWRRDACPSRPGVEPKSANSRARRATTQAHTTRMTHSTKRACQRVDPRKRDAGPRGEESRGCGRVRAEGRGPVGSAWEAASSGSSFERAASAAEPCPARARTAIRKMMPIRPPHAKTSVSHSQGGKWPRKGRVKVWSRSCAYPVTRVRNRIGKETMTSQWAHLIHGRPLNSRWVSAAERTPHRRLPTGRSRPGSGVPEATVRHMCASPRAKDTTARALTRRANPHMMALSVGLATSPPHGCCTPLWHLGQRVTGWPGGKHAQFTLGSPRRERVWVAQRGQVPLRDEKCDKVESCFPSRSQT